MFRFNLKFFILSILLFATEVLIALYVHDRIIRPYIGDYLVVILIYCMVRTIYQARVVPVALGVLLFSYFIEMMQYFRLVKLLGLQQYRVARIVIGTSSEWGDILAYTLGILTVIVISRLTNRGTGI